MSAEQNKAIVRRAVEDAFNKRNPAAVDGLYAPDFVLHYPALPEPLRSAEALKQMLSAYFAAFPDFHEEIEDMIAEGDRVVARRTWQGTHRGPLMGLPPTGKPVTVTGVGVYRIANGKIAEQWEAQDDQGLMRQLGVMPTP